MPTLEELNEKLESGEITQADIIANGSPTSSKRSNAK